jgi:ABC-type sugar transport system permease subunit
VLLFISVTGIIGSMQMWEIPRLVTGGGPSDTTYTLMWSIQNDAFSSLQVGLGTAESLVLFILLMVFIGWQLNEYRKQYNV